MRMTSEASKWPHKPYTSNASSAVRTATARRLAPRGAMSFLVPVTCQHHVISCTSHMPASHASYADRLTRVLTTRKPRRTTP
ncbi:hypothetical protein B296_00015342, partial [Ensete ventricosum]